MASLHGHTGGYIPYTIFHASKPVSQSEFEGPSYRMSVPVETGFITDPTATGLAIIVVNLSGRPLDVVKDDPEEINRQYGDQRWNEIERGGFNLPRGRSGHFPCNPRCFIVTFGEWVIGEDGKKYWLSALGKRLNEIANTVITVEEGDVDGELTFNVNGNTQQKNYFTVFNGSDRPIFGRIVVESSAFAISPDVLDMERRSRKPDLGGKIIEEFEIQPGSRLNYLKPPRRYVIRALDPCQPSSQTGSGSKRCVVTPPMNDYVEDAKALAGCGSTVVLLADENKNGGVVAISYKTADLKLVQSDIVVSN